MSIRAAVKQRTRIAGAVARATSWIPEPRVVRLFYFLAYGVMIFGGSRALVAPPESIEGALGAGIMLALSSMLIIGGIAGLIAVLPGWWYFERFGLGLGILGIFAYVLTIAVLNVQNGGRDLQLASVGIGAILLLSRFVSIRSEDLDPSI
jgi:hypothetical protein